MNEVILTVRAMLGQTTEFVFLKKSMKLMRRKARHDPSDKNVFTGARLPVSVTLASFLILCALDYLCTQSFSARKSSCGCH